jgi:hypothetical protein
MNSKIYVKCECGSRILQHNIRKHRQSVIHLNKMDKLPIDILDTFITISKAEYDAFIEQQERLQNEFFK